MLLSVPVESLDIAIFDSENRIPTHVQNWIIIDVDSLLTDWQFKFYSKYKDGLPLHNFGTLTVEPARFILQLGFKNQKSLGMRLYHLHCEVC